jgi:Leucine-rich repeat (LRR) protein
MPPKNLTRLDLRHCQITFTADSPLADAIKELVRLEYLDMSCNDMQDVAGLMVVCKCLKLLMNLKSLALLNCQITFTADSPLADAIKELVRLEGLDLSGNDMRDQVGFNEFCKGLKHLTNLRVLALGACQITFTPDSKLVDALKSMVILETLELSGNDMRDEEGFIEFCNNLVDLKNLTILNLRSCQLTSASRSHLSDVMKSQEQLECHIEDL